MHAPLVSVIVPTKDSKRFLRACLESIKSQTFQDIEMIVVDNRSSDNTTEIAHHYGARVYEWGPERSAQVNYGVQQAGGTYIYKVDSDFVLHPQVIEQCVAEIVKGTDAVVVHNSPDIRVSWIARVRKFEVDMYKYDIIHSSARFVKRDVYLAVGGFDESVTAGEDYDFQNKLNRAGYVTGFIEAEAIHLGEPTSFRRHMKKYFDYGIDFVSYRRKNKMESREQLGFLRSVYVRNWRRFIEHPVLGLAFVFYSSCKFGCGGAGLLIGTIRDRRASGQ